MFIWFTIRLKINRVALRVLDDALAFGLDFENYTYGDVSNLTDLTRSTPPGTRYEVLEREKYSDPAISVLVKGWCVTESGLAIAINFSVLSRIVAGQVAPFINGTQIDKGVVLIDISIGYGKFEKDLRGPEDGLWISVLATYKNAINAYVDIYLQPFNWQYTYTWSLFVGRVDVDISWWGDIALAISQFLNVVAGPILFPFAFFEDWCDANSKGDPLNVASQIKMSLQPGAAISLGVEAKSISISAETIDIQDPSLSTSVAEKGGAKISPTEWSVYDVYPITPTVELLGSWKKLNPNLLTANWVARRGDTGAVVAIGASPYKPAVGGNGIEIPHHPAELYQVSEFRVTCVLSMFADNQTGEIWRGEQTIRIKDYIDRSHSFVQWGPHRVHFRNQGTGHEWWHRVRRSRIHRTAVSARCWGLQIAEYGTQEFEYLDDLPFAWSDLGQNRKILCEYCFFNGPEKTTPLPREDWYLPAVLRMRAKIPDKLRTSEKK